MTDHTLEQFVGDHGQKVAAEMIGVSPSAISQMLSCGRCVFVRKTPEGAHEAYELKPIRSIDRTGSRKRRIRKSDAA